MNSFIIKDSRSVDKITHASTKGAILALNGLKEQGAQINTALDIGAGSGILSFYIASHWPHAFIIASDISKLAVAEMQANTEANQLSARVTCLQADGVDHPRIKQSAPYELIVANLLAELHIRQISEIEKLLHTDGRLILSGILAWKMQEVEQAIGYTKLKIIARFEADGWVALMLNKDTQK